MTVTQLIQTVDNNDSDINTAVTTQAADGYILYLLVLWGDDSKAILIFNKTSATA